MSFMDEIRKIPPVTRFLCGSTLAVSLPVMMKVLSPYKVLFVKELVTIEIWRPFSSFFLGGSGINFIFDFVMLYRNSDQLEASHFPGRSADYAWQLLLASISILALNLPLHSYVHFRPLLVALTYLSSQLAPAGSQTSLMGLVSLPVAYFPYVLIGMDLVMGGPAAAASSITGAIAGHVWWWGVFQTRTLRAYTTAPSWMRRLVDTPRPGGDGGRPLGGAGGVHVVPPRAVREQEARATGHNWGSGHRLGSG